MPFNSEGLWTPDETIGQAPLAGLAINNVEQSLVNFRQAQATKREQALLEMLKAGHETGVDVGASPTSQGFADTMGLQSGEESGLFHQLPQQQFREQYAAMSPDDQKNPDKVAQLAMSTGANEPAWYIQQRRNAIAEENAQTRSKAEADKKQQFENQRLAAIQRSITNSMKENQKQFEGPQAAARSSVDQVISRGDLSPESVDKLNAWVESQPTKWPEASQIGSGIKKTGAQTAKLGAETNQINTLTNPKKALIEQETATLKSRAALQAALTEKTGASSSLSKQKLLEDHLKNAQQFFATAQKSGDPQAITKAQKLLDEAQAATKKGASAAVDSTLAATKVPKGSVPLRATTLPDGPAPTDPAYYALGGQLYGPPQ